MSKIVCLLVCFFLIGGTGNNRVLGQTRAAANTFIRIIRTSNVAQIDFVGSSSKNSSTTYQVVGNTILVTADHNKLMNSTVQNLGGFTISSENKNSFTVSLPAHPVVLTNPANGNTVQVTGSQTTVQPDQNKSGKDTRVVNLDGSLKIGSVSKDQTGVYSGTYPITFVYN